MLFRSNFLKDGQEDGLVFTNSGNRPVAILGVDAVLDWPSNASKEPNLPRCTTGHGGETTIEPFVLKEKEIALKTIALRETPATQKKPDGGMERLFTKCLRITLVTPSSDVESRDISLVVYAGEEGGGHQSAPHVIWQRRSTIFDPR